MRISLSCFALGLMAMAGCNPKYYTANTQNVPLISQKGETSINVGGNANQLEAHAAYGVTNGFALQANGGFFFPADLDNGNGGSGRFAELGAGYFMPLEDNFVFEVYGLLGIGSVENHLPSTREDHPSTLGNISGSIFRYGIQPNFGYKSKYFSAAFSSRIVSLNYSNIKGDLIFDNENQVNYLNANKSNLLVEPAFTVRGGIEKIKVQLQVGYSYNLTNSNFRQDKGFLTLGVNFNLK